MTHLMIKYVCWFKDKSWHENIVENMDEVMTQKWNRISKKWETVSRFDPFRTCCTKNELLSGFLSGLWTFYGNVLICTVLAFSNKSIL